MEELCKTIDTIAKDWKFWRQRSFDFTGTNVPEEKFSKEEEMKYLYDAYETAKNDKVMDTLNDRCDKATKEFKEYSNSRLYKMGTPIWILTEVFGFGGLILGAIMFFNKVDILIFVSLPMILVGSVFSWIYSKLENKYKNVSNFVPKSLSLIKIW